MLHRDHELAEPLFVRAIEGAERVGDAALLARVLAYFGVSLRQNRRLAEARAASERVLRLAEKGRMDDYEGVASANLAWAALCDGDRPSVERHVARALGAWARLPAPYVYPFQWLARIPYAAYLNSSGQADAAVAQLTFLLHEHQQVLHDEVTAGIGQIELDYQRRGHLAIRDVLSKSREANYL